MAQVGKMFNGLDEFLNSLPVDKPTSVSLSVIGSEFNLTRDEIISELKKRNYAVAGRTGWIIFHKSAEMVDNLCTNGGDSYEISQI